MLGTSLALVTGILIGVGQFLQQQVSIALPTGAKVPAIIVAVLTAPLVYAFVLINLTATATYMAAFRFVPLSYAFPIAISASAATMLALDIGVNGTHLSALQIGGLIFGLLSAILITIG